jgi:LacI family transcriptional regulator
MKLIPERQPEDDDLNSSRSGAHNGARKRKRSEKTSLADVARLAEVSTATVSRAINMPGKVSAAVRARIEAAVERLRYRPNIAARMLAAQRSWTVGAIVPTIQHNVFACGLEAIQARLEEDGFTLLVGSSGYDPERELRLTEAFMGRGVDGLIYVGASHLPAVYAALEAGRVPFVNQGVFDEKGPHPCVGFDNHEAAALAVRHLLDLGHRRIGMVAGISRDNDRAAGRIAGFRETLAALGDAAWSAPIAEQPYTIEGGRAGLAALLTRAVRPSAIVCGNDILAQACSSKRGSAASALARSSRLSASTMSSLTISSAFPRSTSRSPRWLASPPNTCCGGSPVRPRRTRRGSPSASSRAPRPRRQPPERSGYQVGRTASPRAMTPPCRIRQLRPERCRSGLKTGLPVRSSR